MKRSSLQKRVSKFTPKKFYMIDPCYILNILSNNFGGKKLEALWTLIWKFDFNN